MNTTKSVSTAFYLNNHDASITLNIKVRNKILPSDLSSKYLGVTPDKQLNCRKYLEGCANKIAKRNCTLRKLARTRWGASQSNFRTSTPALRYSAAEYCAPVWRRSPNTKPF
ncbi:RNA-directed DNA polymerase from mobile element jockey-like [Elysia marginata]|uniref:RNA-directed DNA polymerase from mobile element jockey-like n=1 Tax=Elysia marginata TaxID=1093978 RepID=A0AAV4F9R2_9GAST|nr:RNA-directed DNA polymerase from mobile element jockey-like [Elysia marginata]